MKPMLAQTYDGEHRITYPVYCQPKFNGVRALYQNGRFQSREEIPWNEKVLVHIAEELKKYIAPDTVIDGELYRHGWPLQRIAGAVSVARTEPSEDTLGIQYIIFDVVNFGLSFKERFYDGYKKLAITNDVPFALATTTLCHNPAEVNNFYSVMVDQGFEGIMYRLGDCPYTTLKQHWAQQGPFWKVEKPRGNFLSDKNNRTWHLLKRKAWQDGEFSVVEIEEGKGKRQGKVGAFIFACGNGRRGRVGSGLSDHEAEHYFLHPEEVLGKKIKVKFLTLTSDGIPFNPTFEQIVL